MYSIFSVTNKHTFFYNYFQISDIKHSIFVGGHLPTDDQYAGTKFEAVDGVESLFSVQLDSNGLFQSVDVPAGFSIWQKNLVKGWANQLQVNAGKIQQEGLPTAFKSEEVKSSPLFFQFSNLTNF